MATNVKAKKKKGTYDNKWILWISIGLAAFVVLAVGIFLIVNFSTNYVAKVGNEKIYTYEFNYFLREAISEEYTDNFEEPEGYDDMTTEEQDKLFDEFFTDERRAACVEAALEKAREFKAEYRLAVQAGFKLSSEERSNVKSNVDLYYNLYVNAYGYSAELATYYMTRGAMTLSEYKDFMILNTTIEKYKNYLKEGYTVTDDNIRDRYEEEPNDYRSLSARVFMFDIPTKPSVPKDDSGNEIKENTADDTLREKYEEYLQDLEDYEKQIENYKALAEEMRQALEENGKYTFYDRDMVTNEIKTEDGENGEKEQKKLAEDANFESLCTTISKWASASSNKGLVTINNNSSSGVEEIDKFVLQIQWNDGRTGFIFVEAPDEDEDADTDSDADTDTDADADKDTDADADQNADANADQNAGATSTDGENTAADGGESGDASSDETNSDADADKDEDKDEDEDKPTPSELKIIEVYNDDDVLIGLYIVRVENITDIDTEPDEDDEDGLNDIQASIKSTLLEEMAVADLEQKVADAGSKFALKARKQKRIDAILQEILPTN